MGLRHIAPGFSHTNFEQENHHIYSQNLTDNIDSTCLTNPFFSLFRVAGTQQFVFKKNLIHHFFGIVPIPLARTDFSRLNELNSPQAGQRIFLLHG